MQPQQAQKFNIIREALPILARFVYMLAYFAIAAAIYSGFVEEGGEALDASFWIGVFLILAIFCIILDWLERARAAAAGTPYQTPPPPETPLHPLQNALTSINVISWLMYLACFLGLATVIYISFIAEDPADAVPAAPYWITTFILWPAIITILDRKTPLVRPAKPSEQDSAAAPKDDSA